jgi:two-component system chemotaxis response regulator CheB
MAQINRDIIVIGASAGGVEALQCLVGGFTPKLPASIFVVQHLWPKGESHLAPILERAGLLPVVTASEDAPIERGKIYVAPPDQHMMLAEGKVVVARSPHENRARPAINPLFRSAAHVYRQRVIGVILTGTLDDGAAGLWAVKGCGGVSVVQSDAAFGDMPRAACENVEIDHSVPLLEIAPLLNRLASETIDAAPAAAVPPVVQLSDEGAKMKTTDFNVDKIGRRSVLTCPECHGALWELDEGVLEHRCHVGHAYSAETLIQAQNAATEQALWGALRALKESAALDRRLADRSAGQKLPEAADAYLRSASAKIEQAAHLQEFLVVLHTRK